MTITVYGVTFPRSRARAGLRRGVQRASLGKYIPTYIHIYVMHTAKVVSVFFVCIPITRDQEDGTKCAEPADTWYLIPNTYQSTYQV